MRQPLPIMTRIARAFSQCVTRTKRECTAMDCPLRCSVRVAIGLTFTSKPSFQNRQRPYPGYVTSAAAVTIPDKRCSFFRDDGWEALSPYRLVNSSFFSQPGERGREYFAWNCILSPKLSLGY